MCLLSPKAAAALLRCADAVSPEVGAATCAGIDREAGLRAGLGLDDAALWLDRLAEHTRQPHFAMLAGRYLVEEALDWKPRRRVGDRFRPPARGLALFLHRVTQLQVGGTFHLVRQDAPFSAIVALETRGRPLSTCLQNYWLGILEAFPTPWQQPYARVAPTPVSAPAAHAVTDDTLSRCHRTAFELNWSAAPQSMRVFSLACSTAIGVVLAVATWYGAAGLGLGVRATLAVGPALTFAWLVYTCCGLLGRLATSDALSEQQRASLVKAMEEVRQRFDESQRLSALLREYLDSSAQQTVFPYADGRDSGLTGDTVGGVRPGTRTIELGSWIRSLVEEVRHRYLAPPGLIHFRQPAEPVWVRGDADQLRYVAKFVLRQLTEKGPDALDIELEVSLQGCAVLIDVAVQPSRMLAPSERAKLRTDGWTTLAAVPLPKTSSLNNEIVNPDLTRAYLESCGGKLIGPETRTARGQGCVGFRVELRRGAAPERPASPPGVAPLSAGDAPQERERQVSVEMSIEEIRAATAKQSVPSDALESPRLSALAAERLQDAAETLFESVSVLVVAPEQRLRRLIRRTLEGRFHVKTCHDADTALSVAAQIFPDVMVVDMSHPALVHSELPARFAAMGARFSRSPVVALTEEAQLAGSLEYLQSGIGDVLRIPFHPEELHLRVRGLVRAKLWERQLFLAYRDLEGQKAEIEEDLELARSFQQSLLGDQARWKRLGIAVRYEPMLAVGGDLVDVGERAAGAVRIFVADATDHGVQAALRTASIASFYRRVTWGSSRGPARVMQQLNREMLLFGGPQMTCSAACIELERHGERTLIRVSAAGDVGLALASAAGKSRMLPLKAGLPLGILEESSYAEVTFDLDDAGYLTIFSDGLIEQPNAAGVTFLEGRMPAALNAMARVADVDESVSILSAHLEAFRGVLPARDDVVIVAATLAKGR